MISWSTSDVAGVNFGDSHITAARVRSGVGGTEEVTHAGWVEYDLKASEQKIAAAVKSLWRKAGLPTTTVVASLRSASLVVRYFKYPFMPESELRSALRLQAEESLQLTGDELAVDWHINRGAARDRRTTGSGGVSIEGVLAAAPVKDVRRLLSILFMAGLDPIVLDVRAMAVANLYVRLARKSDDPTTCVVGLAPHSADVIVLSTSGDVYPHTVFCRASTWVESPAFLCENIREAMKYTEFKLAWEPVRRVILMGDVTLDGDFVKRIQEGVDTTVETWDPLRAFALHSRLREIVSSDPANAAMLAPSLGLALRRG